jgi:diketogulonate reductase-like aldo/keto reductase
VLLRWCIQHDPSGHPQVDPPRANPRNAQIFDFALANEDMARLDALDQTNGTDRALERKWW